MRALTAQVHHGRLVLDEPTELPEGARIELVAVGGLDDLDDHERAQLHAVLEEGLAQPDDDGIDATDLIAKLRSRG